MCGSNQAFRREGTRRLPCPPSKDPHVNQQNLADFIWNVADVLRGDFKQSIYGRIILPFTLLRRLECVLEPTRDKVRSQYESTRA